jgi:23S rRNA pseudouridine1911/1915/1917 synthase
MSKLAPTLLFEDTHLLVLDKPAGLLSQGEATGDENLVDWLRQYLGRPYVGLVHRLDRNTSGIMIVAKRTKAAQRLTDQLQSGRLERVYRAWLEGSLPPQAASPEGLQWRHVLEKDEARNITRVSKSGRGPKGKEAVLTVRALQPGHLGDMPLTFAEFKLETGRSHQIRAQAAHEGHPLLGDLKYGSKSRPPFGRPALHSFRLSFEHPMSHEAMTFEAKLPDDMAKLALH